MTKVDIFSGFLGAGKTTLIKKLLSEVKLDAEIAAIKLELNSGSKTAEILTMFKKTLGEASDFSVDIFSESTSTKVTSCPSFANCSTRIVPTLPAPTIIIFKPLLFFVPDIF